MRGEIVKIQYVAKARLSTCGVDFNTHGQLEEVSEKDGNYLLKTFPNKFNKIEPTKVKEAGKKVEKDK